MFFDVKNLLIFFGEHHQSLGILKLTVLKSKDVKLMKTFFLVPFSHFPDFPLIRQARLRKLRD